VLTKMIFKSIKKYLIFLTSILLSGYVVCFAKAMGEDPPLLSSIVNVAGRVLNIAVGVAGLVLVVMVAYGVWKSSLASGDPRGLEGAKLTWTYALYGFFIVVGFFAAVLIISRLIGVSLSPSSFLSNVSAGINSLMHPPTY
jgi:hypothetical protein